MEWIALIWGLGFWVLLFAFLADNGGGSKKDTGPLDDLHDRDDLDDYGDFGD